MPTEDIEHALAARVEEYDSALGEKRAELEKLQSEVADLQEALEAYRAALRRERIRLGRAPAEGAEGGGDERRIAAQLSQLSMGEAAALVLERAKGPLTGEEIYERLRDMGWESSAGDPVNSLKTALYREHRKDDGLIRKADRGKFVLRGGEEGHVLAGLLDDEE